jgi:hypothetical protein
MDIVEKTGVAGVPVKLLSSRSEPAIYPIQFRQDGREHE